MFLKKRNGCYATKKTDANQAVSADLVDQIVKAVRRAPTSSGLQTFEFFVIAHPAIRAEIEPVAWGQKQITEASQLLVLAA